MSQELILTPRDLSHAHMLALGTLAPLRGFMGAADYKSVLANRRLTDGSPWTIPIVLSTTQERAASLRVGALVTLKTPDGTRVGTLALEEKFAWNPESDACKIFGTSSGAHPGVALFYRQGEVLLAGKVEIQSEPSFGALSDYWLTPAAARRAFAEKGWKTICGFQTRNAPHRGHEFVMKHALTQVDGLFLHPTAGETKDDDLPSAQRFPCYRALADRYLPTRRVLLALNPSPMYYAGPREAIHHAIMRRNHGCTHFIVGRDHAGVVQQYGPYEAQRAFDEFTLKELGIAPIFVEKVAYCRDCGDATLESACPHGEDRRLEISGTRLRRAVERGEARPEHIVRPEVWEALLSARETVS